MTIGVAVSGPQAGLAIVRALAAVEAVASGAIGGFVSLVAVSGSEDVVRMDVQAGGIRALFATDETGWPSPPRAFANARLAALISSGPNRPAPLAAFTPADPRVGLVTGHRMPNRPGRSGTAINAEILDLMRQGYPPRAAAERVVNDNPNADAGVIALDIEGRLHLANTRRVARRPDLGCNAVRLADRIAVGVLHNSIRPHRAIAQLATEIALDTMAPSDAADREIVLRRGTPIAVGPQTRLIVDQTNAVERLILAEDDPPSEVVGIGYGVHADVWQNGARIGQTCYEPYILIGPHEVIAIDGLAEGAIPVRSTDDSFSAATV